MIALVGRTPLPLNLGLDQSLVIGLTLVSRSPEEPTRAVDRSRD